MSEQQNRAPELEQASERQSLTNLIKELKLPDEVIGTIEKLDKDNKEMCILMLEEIQNNLKSGKILSPADATDKAENTLMDGFRIDVSEIKEGKVLEKGNENNSLLEKLGKDIDAVKSLDPIVGDELEKAKQEKPNLPPELTKTIAEKTGVAIQNLDDVTTKGGAMQQDINNMIDAYYLANLDTDKITELLKGKKSEKEISESFATLRNSARHLDIPVYETAKNVEKLIPDQSDKTQKAVVDTVTSLTRDSPNTLITRTGDKLNWESPDGKKYEIDMAVRPPRLSKSKNGLSISYEKQPENPELASVEKSVSTARDAFAQSKTDVHKSLRNAGLYELNLDKYPMSEVEKLFSGSEFSELESRVSGATTTAEQLRLQTEIRDRKNHTEGILAKTGLQYLENILSEKIEIGETGIGDVREETISQKDWKNKLHSLDSLRTNGQIESYIQTRKDFEEKQKKLAHIKTPGVDDFDAHADKTLSTLTSLGYDELGQQGFDELLEAMNVKNKGTVAPIELDKKAGLENNQEKSLRELATALKERSHQGELRIAMQELARGLKDEGFRSRNWNTPNKRVDFLYQKTEKPSESA